MLQRVLFFSFSFPLFVAIFLCLPVSAQNSNIYVQCSQSCFTSMTPYESNVNSLFTAIVDSASVCKFNKFAISFPGYSQSDNIAYGLFQCRGDLSSSDCKVCVTNSVSQLKAICPLSTGGTILLDGCFVKYDNTMFFGNEDKVETLKRCGPSVGYNSEVLNRIDNALATLITENGQYYRVGDYGSVHGVAQCVQDLSESHCQDCLSEARGQLRSECVTSAWGEMYLGKCYVQYDDQDIDEINNDDDNDRDKRRKQKKKKKSKKLREAVRIGVSVGAIGGGITSTATLGITVYVWYKRKKEKNDHQPENDKRKPTALVGMCSAK